MTRLSMMASHPWDQNDDGLWCPACGELICASFNMDDDYEAPDTCKQCGFPDFEEGTSYFTGDGDAD